MVELRFLGPEELGVKELYDIFLREFMRGTKSGAQTVRGSILHMLGIFCEQFPGSVADKADQLLKIYMDTLKEQSNKAEPDTQLIARSFRGLACYLSSFGASVEDGAKYIGELYKYIVKALELQDLSRYDIPKAALKLLKKRAFLFKEYLTEDAEKMFKRMEFLCNHKNDKVKKAAFPAHEAFISQLAFELIRGARKEEQNQKTFKILMSDITSMLDPKHSGKYRLMMAIRSFGQLAAPMKKYLGEPDTKVLMIWLIGHKWKLGNKCS
jgi:DNA-dependent protein kinase catalytic subunit